MHTLYTIMVYGALCVWRGGNDSSLGIWTKFAACTALVVGLFEYDRVFYTVFAPFEYLLGYTDPRRPNPNTMHEYVPSSPSCFAPPPLLMHLLQRRSTFLASNSLPPIPLADFTSEPASTDTCGFMV